MGIINIQVYGSFSNQGNRTFHAQKSGHVVAAEDAISWLKSDILKGATEQDKHLRLGPDTPDDNWAEFDRRHPIKQDVPEDVVAEQAISDEIINETTRFSHCSFSNCRFLADCIFTDCEFVYCEVRGSLIACNLASCEVTATVFLQCKATESDVVVCHIKPSWEDNEE